MTKNTYEFIKEIKKELLERIKRYKFPSLEEYAKLRIQEGHYSVYSEMGALVLEDMIYVPKKGIFLTKKSPMMDNPKKLIEVERNYGDFYLNSLQEILFF
jgi:hypothetical protein